MTAPHIIVTVCRFGQPNTPIYDEPFISGEDQPFASIESARAALASYAAMYADPQRGTLVMNVAGLLNHIGGQWQTLTTTPDAHTMEFIPDNRRDWPEATCYQTSTVAPYYEDEEDLDPRAEEFATGRE